MVSQEALHKIQVIQVTSSVIPTIMKIYIKNARFKPQPSTPKMHTFASMRNTPFMEIDDKGGEIVQRYKSLIEWGRD